MGMLAATITNALRLMDRIVLLSFVLVGMAGCGGPKPIPVSGKVTLDGKAVANCGVLFIPVAGQDRALTELASGETDAQGQFTLNMQKGSGAMPGNYHVTIVKQETLGMIGSVPGPNGVRIKWIVPRKYSTPETSGLQRTVSPQEHDFVFDLSSK